MPGPIYAYLVGGPAHDEVLELEGAPPSISWEHVGGTDIYQPVHVNQDERIVTYGWHGPAPVEPS